MTDLLLIGVGNPSRGDDAAGRLVAAALRDAGAAVRVVEQDGGAVELLDAWRGEDCALVVDAVSSGAPPGTIHVFDALTEAPPFDLSGCSTHGFGLGEAIGLGKALGQLPRRLVVIGIEGKSFEAGADVSPEVRDVLPKVIERVRKEIGRMTHA